MQDIISELYNINAIKIGNFTLKNGEKSKYYFNLRNIISYPKILSHIGDEIYKHIPKNCNMICGVPYGGIPLATYISTKYSIPLILLRKEVKTHGLKNQIDGNIESNNKCFVLEDTITTGKSLSDAIKILLDNGVNVCKSFGVINRQEGSLCESLITKNDILIWLLRKNMNEKSRICFSADLQDPLPILDKIGKYICAVKLHCDAFEYPINEIIDLSIRDRFMIIEDRKFNDISYIVNKQYLKYKNWVDFVTVHGSISHLGNITGAIVVANMSNINALDVTNRSINLLKSFSNQVAGFVSQSRIMDNVLHFTPGISLNHKKKNDQQYRVPLNIDTDVFIIGRAIYNSEDPKQVVEKLIQDYNI